MQVTAVAYIQVDGAPGDYFRCDRYGLMSVRTCAQNFDTAPDVAWQGRLNGCVNCPVGASHAGAEVLVAAPLVCTRCRRDPQDSTQYRATRQGKVRMVRGGMICVSCFNREREVVLGRNARNTAPKALTLFDTNVGYIVDAQLVVERVAPTKDGAEAVLRIIRRSGGTALVAWVGRGVIKKKRGRNALESDKSRVQGLLWEGA